MAPDLGLLYMLGLAEEAKVIVVRAHTLSPTYAGL